MKREYVIAVVASCFCLAVFSLAHFVVVPKQKELNILKVGFIYDSDESTPETSNFIRAEHRLEEQFGNKIQIIVKNNVPPDDLDENLESLAESGCGIIFTTSYSHAIIAKEFAERYPKIHVCQAGGDNANEAPVLKNYHTFMGEIYEGRYVSGVVAGLKLQELLANKIITKDELKVGYVAAYPYAEVISGYTAFMLGVLSVVPEAKMLVNYTYTWSSFSEEKQSALNLIEKGCKIISQHSATIGPAVACEESLHKNVFHVGYNQSMIDIAPMTSLVSVRINWTPYILKAVEAVLNKVPIEKFVKGNVHGTDVGAGFDLGWVQILELNPIIVADGTEKKVSKIVQAFKRRTQSVFVGNYIAVNPYDEDDTYNLRKEYKENANSSFPTFSYILKDVITIDE